MTAGKFAGCRPCEAVVGVAVGGPHLMVSDVEVASTAVLGDSKSSRPGVLGLGAFPGPA